jgi:hypothetical protein
VSATNLILVRDSSPLRLVFDHNARRGGLRIQTLLTSVFVVQAASFVQQARWRPVCNWWLLNLEAAFDSSSPLSLAVVDVYNSAPLRSTLGKRGTAVLVLIGRRHFPSISTRALFADSLLQDLAFYDSSVSCTCYGLGCLAALLGIF